MIRKGPGNCWRKARRQRSRVAPCAASCAPSNWGREISVIHVPAEIKDIPDPVRSILSRLKAAGHEARLVGGCVRDLIRGVPPGDYDIVTSALPDEVCRLFPRTVPVGISFGVVLVIESGQKYEVATFRTEDSYLDGRRPSHVVFATAEEDIRRRDFTINGLLLDPEAGRIIDY
ncbi:MAG: hypothetical protein COX51_00320, partial [Syntrophobacteraceae bacterium CG23_combo_of_CG06-09_8_20_14_all_50_8]